MKKAGKNKVQTTRELAVYLLTRVECGGAYADRLLASRQVSELEPRDRSFVRELVLGVLRWKLRLDHIIGTYYNNNINSLQPEIHTIIRLGLYQMIYMDSIPDWAAVNESVKMANNYYGKKTAGLVNALLRRFSREGVPEISSSDPVKKLSLEKSCPGWIAKRWIEKFGVETAEAIMASCNVKHSVSIRTNTIKTDPEPLTNVLSSEGFETVNVSDMPGYFNVLKGNGLFETQAYQKGFFTVQDPEAAMATLLLSPEQGEMILDLCSAPGGKTTHIAEMAKDNIHIDAVDINPKRLGLVKMVTKRLGLESITCIEGDSVTFRIDSDSHYDRILCDVPCTGTGVFSKRPDMKWRRKENDVIEMSSLQKAILGNAATLVKPGGVIIYSTCSLEPEENEDIIRWFTSEHDFTVERDDRFKKFEIDYGYLILPHLMNGNGAFAAKLRRK